MKRLIIFVLGFFISCSPPTISSNRDKSADFSQFKTFCFADYQKDEIVLRPDYDNPENRAIIEAGIIEALANLGYTKVEKGSDLMVQYDMLIIMTIDRDIMNIFFMVHCGHLEKLKLEDNRELFMAWFTEGGCCA